MKHSFFLLWAILMIAACSRKKVEKLTDLKSEYAKMESMEQDSIDNPIPAATSATQFYPIVNKVMGLDDSCLHLMEKIEAEFKSDTLGRMYTSTILDVTADMIKLKSSLALYIHNIKLNEYLVVAGLPVSIQYRHRLRPEGAMKLYEESKPMVQKGLETLDKPSISSIQNLNSVWNNFIHSWNRETD